MEFKYIIFSIVLARIVEWIRNSNIIIYFRVDVLTQLLTIITFGFLIYGLVSSESIIYRLTSIFPSYYFIFCLLQLLSDIAFQIGLFEEDEEENSEE